MIQPEDYPYLDRYQWSQNLSAEQYTPYEEAYRWPPEMRRMLRRLKLGTNNMIAVVGMQGVGKTSARENIQYALNATDPEKWVKSFKWHDLESNFSTIIDGSNQNYQQYEASVKYYANKKLAKKYMMPFEDNFDKCEALLTKAEIKKIKYEAIIGATSDEKNATFLIEFPDYDKRNRGQMLRDLEVFRSWWDELCEIGGYLTKVNIVIFFQKELWGGHFSFGKFDVVELKPLPPMEMMLLYETTHSDPDPFTEEALELLGGLARGIVRWFKKYIGICFESFYDEFERTKEPRRITAEDVKQWITLNHLADDWERELMEVFPKSRGLRRKAVELMRLLFDSGEISQTKLTEQLFGDDGAARTTCSRLLAKLEEYDYITRVPGGREKIIKLVTHYE